MDLALILGVVPKMRLGISVPVAAGFVDSFLPVGGWVVEGFKIPRSPSYIGAGTMGSGSVPLSLPSLLQTLASSGGCCC